jgi:hypothetical protein
MHAHSFFVPSASQLFLDEINNYCNQNQIELTLNQNELDQLFLYMTSQHASPELSDGKISDPLHFEIKRGLARRWAFELLLQGDQAAHSKFVAGQAHEVQLSWDDFSQLAEEAKNLPHKAKAVIRASCFLTMNEKLKNSLAPYQLSNDSEEFLTQLSDLLIHQDVKHLIPVLSNFDSDCLQLLRKIYWPRMHLRAMIQTEGFDNITAEFCAGIRSGEFTQADFIVWKWRWITATCGFRLGGGAKYYDSVIHVLTTLVLHKLAKSFQTPDACYLDAYLEDRAQMAGITSSKFQYDKSECQLLGHMAAFSNHVHILSMDQGRIVLQAYSDYCTEAKDDCSLAQNYLLSRNTKAVAPTYVTSVYSNFYAISYKEQIIAGPPPESASKSALYESSLFMFHLFSDLYRLSLDKRVSLEKLSNVEYLNNIFHTWQDDRHSFHFVVNDQLDLIVVHTPSITPRMKKKNL